MKDDEGLPEYVDLGTYVPAEKYDALVERCTALQDLVSEFLHGTIVSLDMSGDHRYTLNISAHRAITKLRRFMYGEKV